MDRIQEAICKHKEVQKLHDDAMRLYQGVRSLLQRSDEEVSRAEFDEDMTKRIHEMVKPFAEAMANDSKAHQCDDIGCCKTVNEPATPTPAETTAELRDATHETITNLDLKCQEYRAKLEEAEQKEAYLIDRANHFREMLALKGKQLVEAKAMLEQSYLVLGRFAVGGWKNIGLTEGETEAE